MGWGDFANYLRSLVFNPPNPSFDKLRTGFFKGGSYQVLKKNINTFLYTIFLICNVDEKEYKKVAILSARLINPESCFSENWNL